MREVNIKKSDLLPVLTANRKKHREIFLEAQEGYRKQAIDELERMLKEARDGKNIRRSVTLHEPVDQTSDYDRVIRMLEMSDDEVVKLDETEFSCYVLDQWHWRLKFLTSNSTYSPRAAAGVVMAKEINRNTDKVLTITKSADGESLAISLTDNISIDEVYGMLEFARIDTRLQQIDWVIQKRKAAAKAARKLATQFAPMLEKKPAKKKVKKEPADGK